MLLPELGEEMVDLYYLYTLVVRGVVPVGYLHQWPGGSVPVGRMWYWVNGELRHRAAVEAHSR